MAKVARSLGRPTSLAHLERGASVALQYVDSQHQVTQAYPDNPNGAQAGLAGITAKRWAGLGHDAASRAGLSNQSECLQRSCLGENMGLGFDCFATRERLLARFRCVPGGGSGYPSRAQGRCL